MKSLLQMLYNTSDAYPGPLPPLRDPATRVQDIRYWSDEGEKRKPR